MRCVVLLALACGLACRTALPPLPEVDTSTLPGAVAEAVGEAKKAAAAEPDNPDRALRYAMTLHAHEQWLAAAHAYARASALAPKRFDILYPWGVALASSGEYGPAADRLRAALQVQDSTAAKLKLAEVLRDSGDLAASAKVVQEVLATDPRIAAAHYALGRTQTGEAAVASFGKALALFPRYGAAQFALAGAYRRIGQSGKAEEALRNYERDKLTVPPVADPEMARVDALSVSGATLLRRGKQAEEAGQLPEAVALHERAVAADPKLVEGWVNLISLYGRSGAGSDGVRQAYQRAIALAPDRADAHYNFGVYCFTQGQLAEARQAWETALRHDPKHAQALHNLGGIYESEGKLDRAAELYRRALAIRDAYPQAHFHLGRILANQKRYAEAVREFEKSLAPPGDATPTYLYALGAVHARAGKRDVAVTRLREAHQTAMSRGQSELAGRIARDLAQLGALP